MAQGPRRRIHALDRVPGGRRGAQPWDIGVQGEVVSGLVLKIGNGWALQARRAPVWFGTLRSRDRGIGVREAVLAPLYSFASRCRDQELAILPLYVVTMLTHLARRFELRYMYPSTVRRSRMSESFRVDAHADEEGIGVGG